MNVIQEIGTCFYFKNYQLNWVFENLDTTLHEEILSLWSSTLSANEASRRLNEVSLTIRDAKQQLIGITTSYTAQFMFPDTLCWFLRIFIQPESRGTILLTNKALSITRDKLLSLNRTDILGIVLVVENEKGMYRSSQKQLASHGWKSLGKGPQGNDLWYGGSHLGIFDRRSG